MLSVARSSILGAVDDIPLQQFPQIGTSQVHGLRGEDGSGSREGWRSNPTDRSSREQLKPESRLSDQSQEQVEAQDHAEGQGPTYVPQGNATRCGAGTGGTRFVVRSRALGDNEFIPAHTEIEADVAALQARMLNLETMLQQVVAHLTPQK